ncbi:MAG TPA: four helix bundle protein [Bacteroidia bacterium]|nr:four helix bundle protein [Bacteroidota bacterium]MBL0054012.1 four helix bundle protein [Bacteroidota bacterium]HRC33072.1 four helix bundle protein [Bacteroidia bacterium]
MATIEKLEEIISWQKSLKVVKLIYQETNNEKFSRDFGLKDQIRRSAVSIPSNIAEGFGRGGNKEFIQFLSIAKGSTFELKTQLLIAKDLDYIDEKQFMFIHKELDDIGKLLTAFQSYLKQSEMKGEKFVR